MARYRMLAPINSVKHYVHLQNTGVLTNVILNFEVVESVVAPATANANSVKEGSIVKAIYIEIWIAPTGDDTALVQFDLVIEKLPNGLANMTNAEIINLGAYENKKNILYVTQGVLRAGGAQAIPAHRQWILIPKGKQRMGLSDKIVVNLMPLGATTNFCGLATFKEFT